MVEESDAPRRLLVLNPNTSDAVTALIAERVERSLPSGWQADVRSAAWGTPSVETAVDVTIAALAVADGVASQEDADGVLVAAFGDPGLDAARELTGVPVAGIGEASTRIAAAVGGFAVLTIQPASIPTVRRMLRNNGVDDACRAVVALPVPVLAAAEPEAIRMRLGEEAMRIAADPEVRSIVLGGGPLGVHAEWLAGACGIQVIDPVSSGVRTVIERVERGDADAPPAIAAKAFAGEYDFLKRIAKRVWPAEQE